MVKLPATLQRFAAGDVSVEFVSRWHREMHCSHQGFSDLMGNRVVAQPDDAMAGVQLAGAPAHGLPLPLGLVR